MWKGGWGEGGGWFWHQPMVCTRCLRCLEEANAVSRGSPPSLVLTHSESMICVPPRAPPRRPFHQALHPLRAGSTG